MNKFFASCPKGMEDLLHDELSSLGCENLKKTVAGVSFSGDLKAGYQAVLWSRFASRVILNLAEFLAPDDISLYLGISALPWEKHFEPWHTIAVDFSGTSEGIRNTLYGAQKVKDAVVDRFVKRGLSRPSVSVREADIRIAVHLDRKQRASVGIDVFGSALHRRTYRAKAGTAPLKENLAAAIVARSSLDSACYLDPMCGSGTLLIEAAMRLSDTAPGLLRDKPGIASLSMHDEGLWQECLGDARERSKKGIAELLDRKVRFFGYDADRRMVETARMNAHLAGLSDLMDFETCQVKDLENPQPDSVFTIITNPPYGQRLGNFTELLALYSELGSRLRDRFSGSFASVISSSAELLGCLKLRADREYHLYNGALNCLLRTYSIFSRQTEEGEQPEHRRLSQGAEEFSNRLKKNLRNLRRYIEKEQLEAYRIYDADLPNYNAAIDVYGDYAVIQEYQAPKSVPAHLARQRLLDMMQVTCGALEFAGDHIIVKSRMQQKGDSQYQRLDRQDDTMTVREYGAKYIVNLQDYLDTGLFADHRLVRKLIGESVRGRSFLNLFAYTGTASVQAALGGAASVTTVDMSRTYLNTARENMRINNIASSADVKFIQADCLKWLKETADTFDFIYVDPPTFSNSKRMETTFDVQRDHIDLLEDIRRILKPGGRVLFSNNRRGFRLDKEAVERLGFAVTDISRRTLARDYESSADQHHVWFLDLSREA
ncbi:MAG: bifunctional 23S rRNA (guanine(2069)-N(7))-methyltransferase RlmK/23S rRNA (guanine(2445)-N(2))-methyltransferase RlmL [Succinivibrionaceae bacterium]|nr:bifunctional 23S rRNA (guanine(2069)-N(7))-methyltransferase RlmK/23S rRNA (guanine(2445)-N(2))-methyltransferase RlmL [Succinivibrionaceae bacterium]